MLIVVDVNVLMGGVVAFLVNNWVNCHTVRTAERRSYA